MKTLNRKNTRLEDDFEEEESPFAGKMLGYSVNSFVVNTFTVPLDEAIVDPAYYRSVVNT